jgi:hypothetical protein
MAHLQDPIRKQTLLSIKNGMTRRKASLITATNFGPSNPEIVDKSEQRRALIANPRGKAVYYESCANAIRHSIRAHSLIKNLACLTSSIVMSMSH